MMEESRSIVEIMGTFVTFFGSVNNIRASDCNRTDGNGWIVAFLACSGKLSVSAIEG